MNPLRVFFGIFSIVGLICLAITVPLTYRSIMKSRNWEVTTGTITSLSSDGFPTITFNYKGKTYSFRDNERGQNVTTGLEVDVHFPKDKPELGEPKSFIDDWLAPLLLGMFALIFGGIGLGGFAGMLRRSHIKQELVDMGKGRKIKCPATVSLDTSFTVNGRHPYVIIAQQLDKIGSQLREFKSEHIWFDPTGLVEQKRTVDVFVDPEDPTRYWVDISFLPKKAS